MTQALSSDSINTIDPTQQELAALLQLQRSSFWQDGPPSAALRRNRIDRLTLALLENATELAEAIDADYGRRPETFSLVTDVLGLLADAEHIRDGLEQWMEPEQLDDSGQAFVQHQPLGVVGVIGAWNFPVTLALQPAIAALDRVLVKMPDATPRTAQVVRRIIADHFSPDEIAVVTGGLTVSEQFSALPFDHLMFTGSPGVGALVQRAAAANLVPVTLELGGKNPMIIDAEADLDLAADRVAVSRMANGGQICLCGDYALVPEGLKHEFVERLMSRLGEYFPTYRDNPAAIPIVNAAHYERIIGLIDDAVTKGARKLEIVPEPERGTLPDSGSRLIPPTLLLDVPDDAAVNQQEIFGPVLPVHGYRTPEEAIDYVRSRPAPLAAYWYGPDNDRFRRFCQLTASGGVTRNDGFAHASHPSAPFGGVGRSGHGAYHGRAGFDRFTHRRPVVAAGSEHSTMGAFVGVGLSAPELRMGLEQAIGQSLQLHRARVSEVEARTLT